mmetsp:Transcript_39618/g.58250  ORF Transcript_39618/g.58250 Transcript_39618/m.58250 type:complete len:80 (+) Transcript_39618:115-354(+)
MVDVKNKMEHGPRWRTTQLHANPKAEAKHENNLMLQDASQQWLQQEGLLVTYLTQGCRILPEIWLTKMSTKLSEIPKSV